MLPTNLALVRQRIAATVRGRGTPLTVLWNVKSGGTASEITGATVGGVETVLSGFVYAVGLEEPARTVLRQNQELDAGDLILDFAPGAAVQLFDGQVQSGLVPLAGLKDLGLRLLWNGTFYNQRDVGEKLANAINVTVAGVKLTEGYVFRRST